jgi:hypothetical protein
MKKRKLISNILAIKSNKTTRKYALFQVILKYLRGFYKKKTKKLTLVIFTSTVPS